ncbi:hypothetical protein T4E_4353 [Trichinella pseudospiralis]|uniref:HTH CENPB-type domain-containing protein n=1 Tax=Trichinella pseudospiralis TaxID=6337 RepID=A0A0V0XGR3_TRIPS|nr:hypothetical protein T4E_4353 [Trichinella pseudospiralis]
MVNNVESKAKCSDDNFTKWRGQGKKADGQLIYGSCGSMIPELMVSLANYADVSGSSEPALSDWQSTIQGAYNGLCLHIVHVLCALLTSSAIREKGRFLYGRFKQAETSESSRPTFTASKGWLDHFKRCFLLRNIKMSREAISEYQLAASSYPEELKPLIEKRVLF